MFTPSVLRAMARSPSPNVGAASTDPEVVAFFKQAAIDAANERKAKGDTSLAVYDAPILAAKAAEDEKARIAAADALAAQVRSAGQVATAQQHKMQADRAAGIIKQKCGSLSGGDAVVCALKTAAAEDSYNDVVYNLLLSQFLATNWMDSTALGKRLSDWKNYAPAQTPPGALAISYLAALYQRETKRSADEASNSGVLGWVNNAIGSAGKAVSSVIGTAGDAVQTVGNAAGSLVQTAGNVLHAAEGTASDIGNTLKGVPFVGPLFHAVWDGMTAELSIADAIARGQRLDKVAFDALTREVQEVKDLAPYVQMVIVFVPGIGPVASGAIGVGCALAEGQPITEALAQGVLDAIPGGAIAKLAFRVGKAALDGKNVAQVGLAAVEGLSEAAGFPIPDAAKQALSVGVDATQRLANGGRLDQVLLSEAGSVLPSVIGSPATMDLLNKAGNAVGDAAGSLQAQLDIADKMIAQGQKLISSLPPEAQKALQTGLTTGLALGHAQNLQSKMQQNLGSFGTLQELVTRGAQAASDAVVSQAKNLLPSESRTGFNIGVGLLHQQITPIALFGVRSALSVSDRKGFDVAASLHIGRASMTMIPPSVIGGGAAAVAGFQIVVGATGASVAQRDVVVSAVSTHPAAQIGASIAASTVQAASESWWHKVLRFLHLGN